MTAKVIITGGYSYVGSHTIIEVINSFEKVSKVKLNIKLVRRREGDIASLYAYAQHLENTLGWKAKYRIVDMIRSSW